jgi:hypothetical protein
MNEDPTGQTNKGLQMPMSTKKNTSEATFTNSVKKKSPPDNKEEAESERLSASNIFPILTA